MIQYKNTVGGQEIEPKDSFESFNPFTGKPWALVPRDGAAEVDAAVATAKAAFQGE